MHCFGTNNTMVSLRKRLCLIKEKTTCNTITTIVGILVVLCIGAYDTEILKSIVAEYVNHATPLTNSFAASQSNLSLLEDKTFYCLSDSECLQLGKQLVLQKYNESCYTFRCNSSLLDGEISFANIYSIKSKLLKR